MSLKDVISTMSHDLVALFLSAAEMLRSDSDFAKALLPSLDSLGKAGYFPIH